MNHFGIIHNAGNGNGPHVALPLEGVSVRVQIVDTSAKVKITQTYSNPSDVTTSRAKYCFPVPASAAVCGFSMKTSDGRIITGICKEKDTAREEYEQAVSGGQFSGLLEYVTDDLFTISVGSISAHETARVQLVYVMDLMDDDHPDAIRFQLPMCVGKRYGVQPLELENAHSPSFQVRVRIAVDIQTSGAIEGVKSINHPGVKETRYWTNLGRPSRRRTTVTYHSASFLSRDFVLIIQAAKLNAPRCFAELEMDKDGRTCTAALQLNVVPKFSLPPLELQEYIFLVDRSGSMSGPRIETAKRTLATLLRMIPRQGSTFNVHGFGSTHTQLWDRSKRYDQVSLTEATSHVDRIGADLGGTEIRLALDAVFRTCDMSRPVALFVLTDGEAHDLDATTAVVQAAVQARKKHPLRVFTLGIGETVSSAMCEGIARAGNGICLYAADTESILAKCARLFRSGRTPFVKDVKVDWGFPADYLETGSGVDFVDPSSPPSLMIRRPPVLQQAPAVIHDLHAGARLQVYAILTVRKGFHPKEVTLSGLLDSTGESFSMSVPIHGVNVMDKNPELPLIHTMAAWRLIQEHAERRSTFAQLGNNVLTDDALRKGEILRLGKRYHLITEYTAFVAVDSGSRTPLSDGSRTSIDSSAERSYQSDENAHNHNGNRSNRNGSNAFSFSLGALRKGIMQAFWKVFGSFGGSAIDPIQDDAPPVPGGWPGSGLSRYGADRRGYNGESDSTRTFSTLSSLESRSSWSEWSHSSSRMSEGEVQMARSPSPQFEGRSPAPPQGGKNLRTGPRPRSPPPAPAVDQKVTDLIRIQLYDGSFALNDQLRNTLGIANLTSGDSNIDDTVWGTALAVAFIRKYTVGQGELVEDLLAKALEFLSSIPEGGGMLRRAEALFT